MSGNPPELYENRPWRVNGAIRELFEGRSNAVGTVTLTPNSTTTVVEAINVGNDTKIFLTATTGNAAAEVAAGLFVSDVAVGTFTINHSSDADVDKTFFWVGLG